MQTNSANGNPDWVWNMSWWTHIHARSIHVFGILSYRNTGKKWHLYLIWYLYWSSHTFLNHSFPKYIEFSTMFSYFRLHRHTYVLWLASKYSIFKIVSLNGCYFISDINFNSIWNMRCEYSIEMWPYLGLFFSISFTIQFVLFVSFPSLIWLFLFRQNRYFAAFLFFEKKRERRPCHSSVMARFFVYWIISEKGVFIYVILLLLWHL